MSNEKPAAQAAKGGNGKIPLPVIERKKFVLEDQVRNRWCVTLPQDAGKEHLSLASTYAAAPEGVQRFDVLFVIAADDSFMAEVLVLEPAKSGAIVQVLRVFDLPPRRQPGARGLHPAFNIRMGTSEEGLIVERTEPGGAKHVMTTGRDHPEWQGQYDRAEEWLRSHAAYAAASR